MNSTRKKPYPMRGWMTNSMLHAPPAEHERIEMIYSGGIHIAASLREAVDVFTHYCKSVATGEIQLKAVLYRRRATWAFVYPDGRVVRALTHREIDVETQKDKA